MKRLALVLLPVLLLAACGSDSEGATGPRSTTTASSTTTTAAPETTTTTTVPVPKVMSGYCERLAERPETIVITCADAGIQATKLSWSTWGPETAEGTATMLVNQCNPNCASDDLRPYTAKVELQALDGGVFSKLEVTWTGTSPTGQPVDVYELATTPLPK